MAPKTLKSIVEKLVLIKPLLNFLLVVLSILSKLLYEREAMALQKAMVSSKTNEWETPQDFFNKLNGEFNFHLDVSATKENAKCKKFFTLEDDGLSKDWGFNTCWMNPPYGGHTGDWIKKAYEESKQGAVVVCLIVSSTDRSYWHEYIFPFATQIRFIRGRLKFGNSKTTAPFASAVVIFSKNIYKEKITYEKRIF